ncbi:MAG: hypothetical protein ABR95_03340 [Sphingobacteriales bacterium BACL12 MAG-120813-bin55]|jgi:hypothetical protein|nr:MAG: hypothetical protein ABR94_06435 [Sphingobacteriales bacterium BACL12 MAG-120802-bin5]KRP11036.1 MAG: hypothetical protein ABR95_03340 [Sphingobacteriales bacterium BACL12 MAG-120813-bin55]
MEKRYKLSANKKLAAYSAMAGAFIVAGAGSASGQIVYTDIDPDETYGADGDIFELDLNGDGVVDLALQKVFATTAATFSYGTLTFPGTLQYNHIYAIPATGNGLQGSYGAYGFAYAYALDGGATIGAGEDFVSTGGSLVFSLAYNVELAPGSFASGNFFSDGNWFGGQTDKYLGIRFDAAGNEHYGWLRMDVASDNIEFTVKDYAFEATPETDIDAGVSVSINNLIDPSAINAYSFGNTIHINVNGLTANDARVQVVNALGQVVYNNALNLAGMSIALNNAAEGLYTLNIVADGAVYNKQLFINN